MVATRRQTKKANPHYEFGGPIGALGIVLGLPAVCYGLVVTCNAHHCVSLDYDSIAGIPSLTFPSGTVLFSPEACAVFLGWMAWCVVLHLALPGVKKQGVTLANGKRLTYKLNGMSVFVVTLGVVAHGVHGGWLDLGWVHGNFLALLTAGVAFAYAMSLALYLNSFGKGAEKGGKKLLAKGGDTGNPIYDFFIGRELNPRIGSFDLKVFCELVPGLIGWLLLDLGFAHKQFTDTGSVSPAMALVCFFQALYVADALWFEPAILTTMDVTTDGFGFMLVFGDLVWVPFTYSLQARYCLERPQTLSNAFLALILIVKCLGYAVFRGSNLQKNWFRNDHERPARGALNVLTHEAGHPADHQRVVGHREARQLPGRLAHVVGLVPALRVRSRRALLLRHLLWHPARAPGHAGRGGVPGEVRQGLGQVLRHREVQADPLRVLGVASCFFLMANSKL